MQLKKLQVTVLSASLTALMCSSVAQASDLQIYAMPTAGQKTLVMMVDVSGSMRYRMASDANPGSNEKSRLDELKAGLEAVLNSTDPKLDNIVMGLGKYPGDGDNWSTDSQYMRGKILVEAKKLGPATKNAQGEFISQQRRELLTAVQALTAIGATPTAHGLTEAASYLMGTRTNSYALERDVFVYDELYRTEMTQTQKEECHDWRTQLFGAGYCDNGSNDVREVGSISDGAITTKKCGNLAATWGTANDLNYYRCTSNWSNTSETFSRDKYAQDTSGWSTGAWSSSNNANGRRERTKTRTVTTYYYSNGRNIVVKDTYNTSNYSGMADSVGKVTTDGVTHYKSPLPTNKVSCDGQGIYLLSDGKPNASSESAAETQMKNALANPLGQRTAPTFTCATGTFTNALSGGDATGAWQCIGEFAKQLYKGANPAGVRIQTAFVGYSSAFSSVGNTGDVTNACKVGSRKAGDTCSYYQANGISPNFTGNTRPYKINHPEVVQGSTITTEAGFGNGGFYTANSANDVTTSVLNFIDNLGTDPLSPLSTGQLSIPVDNLDPNGLQSIGYLRMLEPNPAQPSLLTWAGNLKKYTMNNGVLKDGTSNIFTETGEFVAATKNIWRATNDNDGGLIRKGGTYEMLPMPTTANTSKLRNLFTDAGAASNSSITALTTYKDNGDYDSVKALLKVPSIATGITINKDNVVNQFRTQTILSDFPLAVKLKLLNFIGYKVDPTLTQFPQNSAVESTGSPFISMGGVIHSFPVQMTYSGLIDSSGELASNSITLENGTILKPRKQSVMYGSMEGGLHIVDAETGVEQMVFVPTEILNNTNASMALVPNGSGTPAPTHGVDAPWVVDSTYRTTGTYPNSQINATKMNVYGGLRMGGTSYYGLDVLDLAAPKLKFRVGPDMSDYSRMGQSWSKPVLINIRYQGKPTRALVVGGGYDLCYEEPRFTLSNSTTPNDTSCAAKTRAKGNAVYIIDAETGKRLFWASNTGSNADNANLRHSVVSRISPLDRDGDGYIDHLYFGDLGGQIFRVDLDNYQTATTSGTSTTYSNFGVRTVRLADLETSTNAGDRPRFYEPVTLTIHDEANQTFILVGAASGDRSTPLDVAPAVGREGLSPTTALTGRPTNKVFGIFDRDFIKKDLITNKAYTANYTSTTPLTGTGSVSAENRLIRDIKVTDLIENPQAITLAAGETIRDKYLSSTAPKHGWYRSLSWSWDYEVSGTGKELANGTFRKPGGLKAFEEPIAIGNNLFVPVYDPEGDGVTPSNPCLPRVIGETDRQQYCLPFGVCLNDSGAVDTNRERKTGFKVQLVGTTYKNTNVIGKGIQGIALASKSGGSGGSTDCGAYTLSSNTAGLGEWQCTRKLNPTRWFEKR